MATIKCKYAKPYCNRLEYGSRAEDDGGVQWSNYFFCDNDDGCLDYLPDPEEKKHICNPRCIHSYFREGRFEKSVKNYEYEDNGYWEGWLKFAGKTYPSYTIQYLEIDGEVLKDEKEG